MYLSQTIPPSASEKCTAWRLAKDATQLAHSLSQMPKKGNTFAICNMFWRLLILHHVFIFHLCHCLRYCLVTIAGADCSVFTRLNFLCGLLEKIRRQHQTLPWKLQNKHPQTQDSFGSAKLHLWIQWSPKQRAEHSMHIAGSWKHKWTENVHHSTAAAHFHCHTQVLSTTKPGKGKP